MRVCRNNMDRGLNAAGPCAPFRLDPTPLRLADRLRGSPVPTMANMPNNASRHDEEAAAAVIARLVDVANTRRPDPGKAKAPDWRLKLASGSVVYVEVTTNVDGETRAFHTAVTQRDGAAREWPDDRLAYWWEVLLADHDPASSRGVRRVKDVVPELGGILADVESAGGSPAEMAARAAEALSRSPLFTSPLFADPRRFSPYPPEWPDDSSWHAQNVRLVGEPDFVGPGPGGILTIGLTADASAGQVALVTDVRRCIAAKRASDQFAGHEGARWLAVMLSGLAADQLCRNGERRPLPRFPRLDITFDYFDEVWAITEGRAGYVVLRLTQGGTDQRHIKCSQLSSP